MQFSPRLPVGTPGSFTFVFIATGTAYGLISNLMPVWLTAGRADDWLAAEPDDAMAMLLASEPPAMEAYRVSRAVNTPRSNTEQPLEPVS
ncbi:hypothetical protein [Stenotrophomonas sp. PS02301]|uniref:hypothetical protein n=1 Tax=Stenotrophomonas sp. PS02301 TaxID=2991427 RepID=UPI00249B0EC9|nr:hypothetical protein [Stenotrophomonas sp. PS02301]